MKQLSIALLIVFAFGLVLLAVAFSEGRLAVSRAACAVCGDTGQVDCPSCEDGWQSRSGAGFSRQCPVCAGHVVFPCPACGQQ